MFKLVMVSGLFVALNSPAFAQVSVQGYTRRDGTYVEPHHRTAPDSDRFNNFSTQGNTNPYTGQPGRVDPYGSHSNSNSYNNYGSGGNTNSYGTRRGY